MAGTSPYWGLDQSANLSPETRWNSRVLFVTKVAFNAMAWDIPIELMEKRRLENRGGILK